MRTGDDSAYAELYRRHQPAALRLARRYARSPGDADDVVSAAFADILQAIRGGSGPTDSFRYYLLACVRRNGGRFVSQRWTMPLDEASDTSDPELAVGSENGLDRVLAWQAFRELPPRYQTALWHALVEDETMEQVGTYLGVGANAAVAVVHRAKESLREAFLSTLLAAPRAEGTCEVTSEELAALVRRPVRGRKLVALEEHVVNCPDCQERLVELQPVEQAMRILIGPAVLGIPVCGYLARPAVAMPVKIGGAVAGVAAVVAVVFLLLPSEQEPASVPIVAAPSVSASAGEVQAPAVSSPVPSSPLPDAVPTDAPASPPSSAPRATGSPDPQVRLVQPASPVLYPGEAGVLRLQVAVGEKPALVRVQVPSALAVDTAVLTSACSYASGEVRCAEVSGSVTIDIPFTLAANAEMGSAVGGASAWVERGGVVISGPLALEVTVHADPCCTQPAG